MSNIIKDKWIKVICFNCNYIRHIPESLKYNCICEKCNHMWNEFNPKDIDHIKILLKFNKIPFKKKKLTKEAKYIEVEIIDNFKMISFLIFFDEKGILTNINQVFPYHTYERIGNIFDFIEKYQKYKGEK